MTNYSWDTFDQIFFSERENQDLLVSVVDNTIENKYKCTIEFTLNPPQTANYKRLKSATRVSKLESLGEYLRLHTPNVSYKVQTIETYKSGYPHSHGYLCIDSQTPFNIAGLVQDVARTWHSQMPGKHSLFNENDYYYKWDRYRCPSIVLQYREVLETDRFKDWNTYIHKEKSLL